MEERTEKQIVERGAKVREIDQRRKQIRSEIEEREAEDARLVLERDREIYAIQALEMTLDNTAREKSWTAHKRHKKEGDPLSLPVLIQQVLDKHPGGLKPPALWAEVRKLGFRTDSKNPIGLLTSTLHRRPDMFARRNAGHRNVTWCLAKYAHILPPESNAESAPPDGLFSKLMKGEFPSTPTLRRVT